MAKPTVFRIEIPCAPFALFVFCSNGRTIMLDRMNRKKKNQFNLLKLMHTDTQNWK